jgi:hypothetical protein
MNGVKSNVEIGEWLSSFQKEVNLITGGSEELSLSVPRHENDLVGRR